MDIHQKYTVWSLVKNNEFEKACKMADEGYTETGDMLLLRNKIYALFHLKKYQEIIHLSEALIEIEKSEYSSESDFISLGIANWLLGDELKAIEVWQNGQNCIYKDAAGGIEIQVFLYFAAVKTKNDKLKLTVVKAIKKILKSKRSVNYPGPLGHYLLNDITERQLSSYVVNVPILRERQLCQAHFVAAIKILETGDTEGYYRKLKASISYGSPSYLEQMYYLAKGELENNNKNDSKLISWIKKWR